MADSFPSTLVGPTTRERRYDRQLRLWAASGQKALEESRVLLVSSDGPLDPTASPVSGVVGVETLKNLVLPGVGGFTIVDPATVTESDLGVNFFLEEQSLGKSRAEETCRLLRELNPEVDGDFYETPISELLQKDDFLGRYRLIIVSAPLPNPSLNALRDAAQQRPIPIIYTHSVGFYSVFSLQLPSEFPIVETHPDPASTQDLRLMSPWPELVAAADKIQNLNELDDHQHGHVPYILLLLHYLKIWRENHGGELPSNYKEKTEFRSMVALGARTNNPEGGEENFDEAIGAVLKTINPPSLNSSLREVFEMEPCNQLRPESSSFWYIAAAIKSFHDAHGVLPLPGALPDMKAQSADYISLQNIYKEKAKKDMAEVTGTVRAAESRLGSQTPVPEKEIEVFCKNAAHIKVLRGRGIPQIEPGAEHTLSTIRNNLGIPETLIPIFIATQALDKIVDENQRNPSSATSLDDEAKWTATVEGLLDLITDHGHNPIDDDARAAVSDAAAEVRRIGGGELHNISSLTGGLVAQEALKVLTRQYVPLDNTCIFDGVRSRSEMFRL